MKKPNICYFAASALISISFFLFISSVQAQKMDGIEKDRMKSILNIVKDEVKKNYYDPNYHSINLDDRFKLAEAKLSAATSTGQSLAIIAQTLIDFNDSHLFFVPPSTSLAVEYGWRMKAIGDKVFVTQVKPGSDADKKGLKPGDQILTIGGFHPSKKELWKVIYYYNALSKRESLAMQVVSPEGGSSRDLEIKSQIKKRPLSITPSTLFRLFDDFYEEENDKHRFWKVGAITIWKMPSFEIDPNDVDGLVDRAKSGNSLILVLTDEFSPAQPR